MFKLLLPILITFFLTACGEMGPLYLPGAPQSASALNQPKSPPADQMCTPNTQLAAGHS